MMDNSAFGSLINGNVDYPKGGGLELVQTPEKKREEEICLFYSVMILIVKN